MATHELLNKTVYVTEPHDDHVKEDTVLAKVIVILVLTTASFAMGILPTFLARWFNIQNKTGGKNLIISMLLCFGGGVLLYTTFLHIQPENREVFEKLIKQGKLPDLESSGVRLPELILCIGFFFVYLIEEVVHSLLEGGHHHHTEEEIVLHRTMSIRGMGKEEHPPTLIPRASLSTEHKSNMKHNLLDSSSNSTLNDNPALDLEYIPSVINPEHILDAPKKKHEEPHVHHHDHGKGHSHMVMVGDDDEESGGFAKSVRAFCTVLALSFHAVFEGLAVGLEGENQRVISLALAIAAHKLVISFCVGVELLSAKTRMLLVVLYIGTFAIVTPIGIGAGIFISGKEETPTNAVLQAMAAGTLLYVVFFEVLQREKASGQSGLLQLLAIVVGFAVMFGLGILTAGGHDHGGSNPEVFVASHPHTADHTHSHAHHKRDHHHNHS